MSDVSQDPKPSKPLSESDDLVKAHWSVTAIPGDVSLNYQVTPLDADDAVISVTASFVTIKGGVVLDSYAGSTVEDTMEPRPGQGVTGNVGVDTAVFPKAHEGEFAAILAGTVKKGEDIFNFFFKKEFDPGI